MDLQTYFATRCRNAQRGTFGHECGKPATWTGTSAGGHASGFCDQCKKQGDERHGKTWQRGAPADQVAA